MGLLEDVLAAGRARPGLGAHWQAVAAANNGTGRTGSLGGSLLPPSRRDS